MKNLCRKNLILLAVLTFISISFSASAYEADVVVKARGSKAKGVYSKFRLMVNDVDCGYEHASPLFEEYVFQTPFAADEINEIKIVFENDKYCIGEDRNLCVHSIIINDDIPILATTENARYICLNGKEYPYCGMMQWNGSLVFDVSKLRFHPGNVTLTSQHEVNSFDHQYLEGNLTISGEDITDLSALSGLISLKGSLMIKDNPNLVDINGFNSLVRLGFIHIEKNAKLQQINGFNSLRDCNGMIIRHNEMLKSIRCFQNPQVLL